MDKKNVLILVQGLGGGGQERMALNTANILSEYYNVYLAVFQSDGAVYPIPNGMIDLHLPAASTRIGKIITLIKRVLSLRKVKKEHEVNITYSIGDGANLVNVLSKQQDRVVVSVRYYEPSPQFNENKKKLMLAVTFRLANIVVGISKQLIRDLAIKYDIPKAKTASLYNAFDVATISNSALMTNVYDIQKPSIVTVGRLSPSKGLSHLIRSFVIVKKKIQDMKLYIVGSGPQKEELKKLAFENGVEDDVVFIPFQNNPYSIIARCDVFVCPTVSEGFGNVIVEALACGVPVVSTDCIPGPHEILTGSSTSEPCMGITYSKYGILAPPFLTCNGIEDLAEERLAEAIISTYIDSSKRNHYIAEGKKRVNDFSFEEYRKNIISIFEKE